MDVAERMTGRQDWTKILFIHQALQLFGQPPVTGNAAVCQTTQTRCQCIAPGDGAGRCGKTGSIKRIRRNIMVVSPSVYIESESSSCIGSKKTSGAFKTSEVWLVLSA